MQGLKDEIVYLDMFASYCIKCQYMTIHTFYKKEPQSAYNKYFNPKDE